MLKARDMAGEVKFSISFPNSRVCLSGPSPQAILFQFNQPARQNQLCASGADRCRGCCSRTDMLLHAWSSNNPPSTQNSMEDTAFVPMVFFSVSHKPSSIFSVQPSPLRAQTIFSMACCVFSILHVEFGRERNKSLAVFSLATLSLLDNVTEEFLSALVHMLN